MAFNNHDHRLRFLFEGRGGFVQHGAGIGTNVGLVEVEMNAAKNNLLFRWRRRRWWWWRLCKRGWRRGRGKDRSLTKAHFDADTGRGPACILWPLILGDEADQVCWVRRHVGSVPAAIETDGEVTRQIDVETAAN